MEHESGLSFAAWVATGASDGTDTEYDFTLDYSGEVNDIEYAIGYYTIGYVDTPAGNGGEFYIGLSYAMLSTAAYVAQDYKYYELGLAHSIGAMDTSLTAGYV